MASSHLGSNTFADHLAVLTAAIRQIPSRMRSRLLPAAAWQSAVDQDGAVQEDKHVAKITHLLSRAGGWPDGLRWIVRRTNPPAARRGT